MRQQEVTAADMARAAGVDPKLFRRELRAERFPWHRHNDRWTVTEGSDRHIEMRRVLEGIVRK